MSAGAGFAAKDRQAAVTLARSVTAHRVGRVVYLSGIVPPVNRAELSEHITSRAEVEQILSLTPATVITLRAAVVLGSGSTSFEIIRQVSERTPVHTIPSWMTARVQPIAVVDVLQALLGALTVDSGTRAYDVGGERRLTYAELLEVYARVAGLHRPRIEVPLPTALVGALVGRLTDVPTSTVQALVESLHHDMVCAETDFRADLLPAGYRMVAVEEAIRRSLAHPTGAPGDPETADPMGPMPQDPTWANGGPAGSARVVDAAARVLRAARRGGRARAPAARRATPPVPPRG